MYEIIQIIQQIIISLFDHNFEANGEEYFRKFSYLNIKARDNALNDLRLQTFIIWFQLLRKLNENEKTLNVLLQNILKDLMFRQS